MTIESNKEEINKPINNVFDYLSDLNNYEVLFPQDKIENWQSNNDDCSFKIKGATVIDFKIVEKNTHESIVLKSGDKSPFEFTLTIHLNNENEVKTIGYNVFEAKVNPFLKMMIEKPLTNLFNHLTSSLKKELEN